MVMPSSSPAAHGPLDGAVVCPESRDVGTGGLLAGLTSPALDTGVPHSLQNFE